MDARRSRTGGRLLSGVRRGALAVALAGLALTACGGEDAPPPAPSPTAVMETPTPSPTPSPEALLGAGRDLLRAGRYAEAAGAFALAADRLADDPAGLSAARLGGAVAAYELGNADRSRWLLRLAASAAPHGTPEEARAVYLLGVRLNEAGAFAEAATILRPHAVLGSGLALAPSTVAEYARALAGTGDIEAAETVWRSLLATPGLGEQLRLPILRQRADVARAAGDLEGRRRWLGELAALTGDPAVRHELAAVGFLLNDLDLFEAQLRAIIAEHPSSDEALASVQDLRAAGFEVDAGDEGYVFYRRRAHAEARAVLEPAIGEPGVGGEALAYRTYFLAAAFDDDGFYLQSVPLYDAVAAMPEAGVFAHRARYWAARALESAEHYGEAVLRYDAVARETGGEFAGEAAFRSGFARLRAGDATGAIAAWRAAGAEEARTRYWLGRALEGEGDAEGAQRAYLDALAAEPRSFHGREARRALALDVGGDGRYDSPLAPPPPIDWEALAAWLAARRPGELRETISEAADLALVGLGGRAAEAVALAAARTSDPWELLSLARTATEAGLPEQTWAIAERLQEILGISNEALPDELARLKYPLAYGALLEEHGRANGLDPLLLAALIHQESRWDAEAVSIAAALGLTQVIPPTAAWIAERLGRDITLGELFRPATAIEFGAYYLGVQVREFGDVHQALAAYNGGPMNVERWAAAAPWPPADFVEAIVFQETRHYVQLVMEHYAWYRALYGAGTGG